jgi:hypothetical protein
MKPRIERRGAESGFALLFVFVMAAAIGITLFIEVPRIAFESQRAREQMAIDRGLQYQRAIQLFYRKFQLYPQTLDDLETKRNIRFLRRRYTDPLTGKEWRLLHVGPAGQLTDSLVQPPAPLGGTGNGPNSQQNAGQTSTASQSFSAQSSNSTQPNDPSNPNGQPPDPLNMAARRPSDRIIGAGGAPGGAGSGAEPGSGAEQPPPQPDPNQPQQPPEQPVQPSIPVQPLPGQPVLQPTDPNQPAAPADPSQPTQPPPQFPVLTPPSGGPIPGQNPGQLPGQNPGQMPNPGQGSTGFPQNPAFPSGAQPTPSGAGAPPTQAADLIRNILTTPRQPPPSVAGLTTGATGGIAGVASTAEGKGIHVVNDHSKYKEWEFVYDLKKDKTVVGAAGVAQQQQVQQQMQQNQNGTNGLGSGFSGNSPFGSTPTSSPTSGAAPAAPVTPPPSQ